jgi:hypothetical protein
VPAQPHEYSSPTWSVTGCLGSGRIQENDEEGMVKRRQRSRFVFAMVLSLVAAPGATAAQSVRPPSPAPGSLAGPTMTLPATKAPLAAGGYTSDVFGTPLTFSLADADWKGDQQDGQFLELERQMGDGTGVLSVSLFDGTVASDPCAPNADGQVAASAAAFTDWLTGLAVLSASTAPTTLDGRQTTQVDAVVVGTACPNSPWITLWGGFLLFPSEAIRIIALDVGDKVIVVTAETTQSTDLPDFLDVAQPVIDAMTFGVDGTGSPATSPSPSA